MGLILTNFENHKGLAAHESSLVFKIFLFTFFNTFNSFFIIAFIDENYSLGNFSVCKSHDCYQTLSNQMLTIFIVNIIKNIPELVSPFAKQKILQAKSDHSKFNIVYNIFTDVDEEIEKQSTLTNYSGSTEVDGLVGDYMELINQFAFLVLFSFALPFSFLFALLNNVAELQVNIFFLLFN